MTRITDLPTLIAPLDRRPFDERLAELKREIVEAMDPPSHVPHAYQQDGAVFVRMEPTAHAA